MNVTIYLEDTDDMLTDKAVQALNRLTTAVDGLAIRVTALEGKSASGATDAELNAFADSLNAVSDKVDAIDPATTSDTTGQIPAVPSGEAAPPQTF
jgi:hypothetical protein